MLKAGSRHHTIAVAAHQAESGKHKAKGKMGMTSVLQMCGQASSLCKFWCSLTMRAISFS
jgi:hypothetical protein